MTDRKHEAETWTGEWDSGREDEADDAPIEVLCMGCDGCGWCEGSPAFTCHECQGTGKVQWRGERP